MNRVTDREQWFYDCGKIDGQVNSQMLSAEDHLEDAPLNAILPRWIPVSERLPDKGEGVQWEIKSDKRIVYFALNQEQIDEGKAHLVFNCWLDNVPPPPEA